MLNNSAVIISNVNKNEKRKNHNRGQLQLPNNHENIIDESKKKKTSHKLNTNHSSSTTTSNIRNTNESTIKLSSGNQSSFNIESNDFELTEISLKQCPKCNEFDQYHPNDDINVDNEDLSICLCKLTLNGSSDQINNHRTHLSMLFNNPGQIYQYINRCRRWVQVWRPTDPSWLKKCQEFSITTYNILSQNLLLNHLYLYKDNNRTDLEWLERSNRLKKELIELNSDIYCLQEVHMENFTASIMPSMKERGYNVIYKRKTGDNQDGCSILFKKSKFHLQDSLEIEMNRTDISELLDREQVGLVVKLRPKNLCNGSNTNLVVATTHLLFNPRRGDIKLAQLRLLLAKIQRFAVDKKSSHPNENDPYKLVYFPIILCGDFNSEPGSPLIEFIKNGQKDFHGIKCGNISGQKEGMDKGKLISHQDLLMNGIDKHSCFNTAKTIPKSSSMEDYDLKVKHVFNFKSVYPSVDQYNMQLISTSTHCDYGLVDHLFYSYRHNNLRLSAFRRLMNERNLRKIGNIPNSILGSDHMSLSAKFYLS